MLNRYLLSVGEMAQRAKVSFTKPEFSSQSEFSSSPHLIEGKYRLPYMLNSESAIINNIFAYIPPVLPPYSRINAGD